MSTVKLVVNASGIWLHASVHIIPGLTLKQGLGMGSYFRRGLTLEQPNDTVSYILRKKSVLEYIHSHRVAIKSRIIKIVANMNDFNGVLLSKVKVLHRAWGLTFEGVLL